MKKKDVLLLATCILIPNAFGFASSLITSPAIVSWYQYLEKPFFSPPNWIFGPVWTLLYTAMGVSFYLLLQRKESRQRKIALSLFILQYLLNLLWTPVFFGAKEMLVALFIIGALDLVLIATIWWAYKIERRSAYLLIPYLCWVLFATVLNASLFTLN